LTFFSLKSRVFFKFISSKRKQDYIFRFDFLEAIW
jgi:hypothetical protein